MSSVVKGRDQFNIGSETADDDEDVEMAAARGRKWTKSVNGNRDEGLVGLRCREFGVRDSRTRLVLLTMSARLNMRLESIPRVAIDVNAMMAHQVVVVVSENNELIRRDGKGWRSEESGVRASGAGGDEVTDVRKKSRPVEIMSLHHAVHVRSRKVAERVAMIAADSQEMVGRRFCDRSEGQSRNGREVRHRGRRVMIARVESAVVNIRVVRRRKRLDDEVRGSSGRERPRENVRDEVVGTKNNREVERVFLQEEMPAYDLG